MPALSLNPAWPPNIEARNGCTQTNSDSRRPSVEIADRRCVWGVYMHPLATSPPLGESVPSPTSRLAAECRFHRQLSVRFEPTTMCRSSTLASMSRFSVVIPP
jgi:hypothetical protein